MNEQYLSRHLWIVNGKDDLNYPQEYTFRQPSKIEVRFFIDTPWPSIEKYIAKHLSITCDKDGLNYPQEYTFRQPPKQEIFFRVETPFPPIEDLPGKQLSVTFDGYTIASRLYPVGFSGETLTVTSVSDDQFIDLLHGNDRLVVESSTISGVNIKEFDICIGYGYSESSTWGIVHYLPEKIFVDSFTEIAVVDYNEVLIIESSSSDIGLDVIYNAEWDKGIFVNTEKSLEGYLRLSSQSGSNPVQLACGDYHSLILTSNGQVWGTGRGAHGQLGLGNTVDQNRFVYITDNIAKIAAGSFHTLILTKDGRLLTCGADTNGQLGNGGYSNTATPTCVMTDVKDISANLEFSAAIKNDGSLWMWGNNWCGQLGIGTKENNTANPIQVMAGVSMVSCGANHVLALKNDGTVWTWGNNRYGQLGDDTTTEKLTPIQIPALGNNIIAVAAGDCHSVALKADGTVWVWGLNHTGQLGLGDLNERHYPTQLTSLSNIVKIYARGNQTFAIKSDRTLYGWGCGDYGQLGLGTQESKAIPTQIDINVSEVSGGNAHTIYQKESNVFTMGDNLRGQLGDGTNIDKYSPVNVFNLSSYYGYWISPDIDLSQVYSYSDSTIQWLADLPLGTSILVETRLSDDKGANWSEWKPVANGGQVDVSWLSAGFTHALLKIRITLNSVSGSLPQVQSLCCVFNAGQKPIQEIQYYLDALIVDSATDSKARNYQFDVIFAGALSDSAIAIKFFENLITEIFSSVVIWNITHYLPENLIILTGSGTGFHTEWLYVRVLVIHYKLAVVDCVGFDLLVVDNILYDLMAADKLTYSTLVSTDSLEYSAKATDKLDYFLEVG